MRFPEVLRLIGISLLFVLISTAYSQAPDATAGQTSLKEQNSAGYIRPRNGQPESMAGICGQNIGSIPTSATPGQNISAPQQSSPDDKPQLVIQTGHTQNIRAVAISSDGKRLASASEDYTVKIWDLATGEELLTLSGHTAPVWTVAFNATGKLIASGGADDTINIWDATTGRELKTLRGHQDIVTSVAFSPDSSWLLSGSWDGTVRRWDIASGRELLNIRAHTDGVNSVAIYADTTLISGGRDGLVKVWELSGLERLTLPGHTSEVTSVAISQLASLASASCDGTVKLWDPQSGHLLDTLEDDDVGGIRSVDFSQNGHLLATGRMNSKVQIWDVQTRQLHALPGHSEAVNSVAFSHDGQWLASGSHDRTIKMWDVVQRKEVKTLTGHSATVWALAISRDGHWLASAGKDNIVRIWDLQERQMLSFVGHTDEVNTVAFSPDGHWLASGSDDGTAIIWNLQTGQLAHRLVGHRLSVYSVAFSPDNRWLATAGRDEMIRISDVATGENLRTLSGHSNVVTSVAFSPVDSLLASGSWDKTVRLWNPATGRQVASFGLHDDYVNNVAFSPDGTLLASSSRDHYIKVWDVKGRVEKYRLSGHTNYVHGTSFSSDGRLLASGGADATVRLWNPTTGQQLPGSLEPYDYITSVVFGLGDRFLFLGQIDGSIRVWSVEQRRELAKLVSLDRNDWAVVDPQGRFDGSLSGMALMHYVVEKQCGTEAPTLEAIDLEQLKNRYYEPGLLAKVLGFKQEPLRNVSSFDHVELYPEVQPLGDADRSGRLRIQLTNCGGGVGRVQVFVNKKEFLTDARGPRPDSNAQQITLVVDPRTAPDIAPHQRNVVRIVTWNAEGYVHSRGDLYDYFPSSGTFAKGDDQSAPAPALEPVDGKYQADLYAIIAGISDYSNQQLHLHFSSQDAESMAGAIQLAGDRLFGCGHVHIFLFSSSDHAPNTVSCAIGSSASADEVSWNPPTKTNIQQAFTAAGKAQAHDVLLVFFSGHGVAFSDDTYAFPTEEANTIDPNDLSRDSQLLSQTAITSDELKKWVNDTSIDAEHEVLVLDTCKAGKATAQLTQARDWQGDQIRALDTLKDNTGLHVLAGSAADASSYEASPYGHGLLTYALLEGMKGAALTNDNDVDVQTLFGYAIKSVPRLAHAIGQIQQPSQAALVGARSFDIGQLLPADRAKIPLAPPKPVILRPYLLSVEGIDPLGLRDLVRAELRDETDTRTRGDGSPSAFFEDAEEIPGAISPSGTYTVTGTHVSVKLHVSRDGKVLNTRIVQGSTADLAALAAKIVAAIFEVAKTLPPATAGNTAVSFPALH